MTRFDDPIKKLWTTSLESSVQLPRRFDVLRYDFHVRRFMLIWSAIRWDELKVQVWTGKILSIVSFIVCTWILSSEVAIGMPVGPGIVIYAQPLIPVVDLLFLELLEFDSEGSRTSLAHPCAWQPL